MKWAFIVAICIAIFGFIPGMGLPGAIAILLTNLIVSPFYHLHCLESQKIWTSSLMATGLFPIFVPLAFWLGFRKVPRRNKYLRYSVFFLVLLSGAMLVTGIVELKLKSESAEFEQKKLFKYDRQTNFKLKPLPSE